MPQAEQATAAQQLSLSEGYEEVSTPRFCRSALAAAMSCKSRNDYQGLRSAAELVRTLDLSICTQHKDMTRSNRMQQVICSFA